MAPLFSKIAATAISKRAPLNTIVAFVVPGYEKDALLALYDATDGSGWDTNTGWSNPSSDPCSSLWYGVTCSGNHITSLDLSSNGLSGTIPPQLANLTYLESLILPFNSLSGAIPPQLGNLKYLQFLILYSNALSGTIPVQLGNLKYLEILWLSNNKLSGTVPPQLETLNQLVILFMSSNELSGTIPPQLGNLNNLQVLWLSSNQLSGTIPQQLAKLNNLQYLFVSSNKLSGTIPPQLGNLNNLSGLLLLSNSLSGPIPSQLGNLAHLTSLYLSSNGLSGTIPLQLGNLHNITALNLSSNRLSGTIPPQLGNLAHLNYLELYSNSLSGTIPPQLGNLNNLTQLRIHNNSISGIIPRSLIAVASLQIANFSSNGLRGSIPDAFPNSSALRYLDVSHNRLTGRIPSSIASLTNLFFLFVNDNDLGGAIPGNLFAGSHATIVSVFMQNNSLKGNLSFLASQTFPFLQYVDLSSNFLTGTIPDHIFSSPKILALALSKNCFSSALTHAVCNATSLQVIALDGLASACQTRISLPASSSHFLPSWFSPEPIHNCIWTDLPNLTTLHLSGNNLKGNLPRVWPPLLTDLSVSHNQISGKLIQPSSLRVLDVSRNRITGTLLENTSVPENPTAFNCSLNRISGKVPNWLRKYATSKSIHVLQGNLMGCKAKDPTLNNDPDHSSYVCGSDDLERALYVWVTVFGVVILLFLSCGICYIHRRRPPAPRVDVSQYAIVQTDSARQPSEILEPTRETTSEDSNGFTQLPLAQLNPLSSVLASSTSGLGMVDYFMTQTILYCLIATSLFMVGVLPVFVLLNHGDTNSIFSVKYAWIISSAFFSGTTAGITLLILWTTIAVMIIGFMTTQLTKHIAQPSFLLRPPNKDTILSAVLIGMMVLGDAVAMVGINFLYIQIYANKRYSVSYELKLFAQFALGAVKALWNVLVVMIINRLSALNSSVLSDAKRCVLLGTALVLFNNIITPCVVSATTDSQCFLYVFVAPSDITAEYELPSNRYYVTNTAGTTIYVSPGGRLLSTTFTPPFVYSHQCGSSIIRNYVPVYFYSALVSGIVRPLMMLVTSRCRLSSLPCIVSFGMRQTFPHILWPGQTPAIKQDLLPAISIVTSFSNYIAVLLIFGFTCPPLAACVTLAVFTEATTWRALIRRYAHIVRKLEALGEACKGVERAFHGVAYMILVTWACVSILLVGDIVADDSGWIGALWVPVTVASVTLLVLLTPWCCARAQTQSDEEADPSYVADDVEVQLRPQTHGSEFLRDERDVDEVKTQSTEGAHAKSHARDLVLEVQPEEDEKTIDQYKDEIEGTDGAQTSLSASASMTDEMILHAINDLDGDLVHRRAIIRRKIEEIRLSYSGESYHDEVKGDNPKPEREVTVIQCAPSHAEDAPKALVDKGQQL